MGRRDEKSEPWAVESREALRTALIGQPWLHSICTGIKLLHPCHGQQLSSGLLTPVLWSVSLLQSLSASVHRLVCICIVQTRGVGIPAIHVQHQGAILCTPGSAVPRSIQA